MPWWIDGSLYPDTAVPEALESLNDQVDFLARLCAAWDFGMLREWHGLPALPYLGQELPYIRDDPSLGFI